MLLWNLFYSFINVLIMFDICKIYPIWLPPCRGDVWEELNQVCQELTNVVAKFASSTISDLSEAFRRFNISTKA